jgi:hypothetical protein
MSGKYRTLQNVNDKKKQMLFNIDQGPVQSFLPLNSLNMKKGCVNSQTNDAINSLGMAYPPARAIKPIVTIITW